MIVIDTETNFTQFMTRVRDNEVREHNESNEYFQQFMMRVRDNRVKKGIGGNEYF
jgi:hypothetical protein